MYEMRYIAFIDILGFKGKVYNSLLDTKELLNIKRTLDYIQDLKQKNDNDPYSLKFIGMEFSMFSDSVVISYPAYGKGNAFNILITLAHICLDILAQGYIFRGGITMGKVFHKDSICFGPAMNVAVDMEKRAKYPRIIIDPNVLNNGLRYPGIANDFFGEKEFLNVLVKQDYGTYTEENNFNEYILDYLSLYEEFDDFNQYMELVDKTRKLIITEYGNAFSINDLDKRKNIHEKYIWFANYYNSVIKDIVPNYEQLEIKLK